MSAEAPPAVRVMLRDVSQEHEAECRKENGAGTGEGAMCVT